MQLILDDNGRVVSLSIGGLVKGVDGKEIIVSDDALPSDFRHDLMTCYRYEDGELVLDDDLLIAAEREQRAAEQTVARKTHADAILRTAQAETVAQTASPDDVIALSVYLPEWDEGKHAAGEVVTYDGQPYRCAQAHDSTGNPGWTPTATPALWANYHAQSAEMALPWVAPTGAHDAYQTGEWMIWTDGTAYRCLADNTVHGPDALPGAWEKGE